MRTTLTILGVIIGTACIVVMVALGLGSMEQFNREVAGSATLTEITVYSSGGKGGGAAKKIDEKAISDFKSLDGVKSVTPVLEMPVYIKAGKYEALYAQITAMDPEAAPAFHFAQGGMFSSTSGVPQVVIGSNARASFADSTDATGGGKPMKGGSGQIDPPDIDWLKEPIKIWLGGKQYAEPQSGTPASKSYRGGFAGVLQEDQSDQSYGMYMSLAMARTMIKENMPVASELGLGLNSYTSARVYAKDINSVANLLDAVKNMGFDAYSPTEYIESAKAEQQRQQGQLSMMAVISLLVSAIGIANTMLAGIMERRGEIGVMKVIGLSIARIRLVFLSESAAIGMLGGLMGLLVSFIISLFVNGSSEQAMVLGMQFQSGVKLIIPWWLAAGAVAISVAVGMASGIYPAIKATQISPLEAIRSSV